MTVKFDSVETAFLILADPQSPDWGDAFRFLSDHPRTGQVMLDTFRDTLEQMGVEPTDRNPITGEPAFSLKDVARAMGVTAEALDLSVEAAKTEKD